MKTLSPSSMAKFQRCPEQWRRQYLLGQWDRTSVAALVGSAVHESAETNYRQKTVTQQDLAVEEVEVAYAEAFDNEVDEKGGPSGIDWTMGSGNYARKLRPGQAKDNGIGLVRKYHTVVAPTVMPVASEEWFRISVPGVPVDIRGKIDRVRGSFDKDDILVPFRKEDYKFGRNAKESAEASWRLQALTYMLVEQTTDREGNVVTDDIGGLPFGWQTGSWGSSRSEPKIFVPETAPGLLMPFEGTTTELAHAHIRTTVHNMLSLHGRYGPDEPWPTPAMQHTWACNYCPFHPSNGGSCYWWTGKHEAALTLI
jgi:hypothetical protein